VKIRPYSPHAFPHPTTRKRVPALPEFPQAGYPHPKGTRCGHPHPEGTGYPRAGGEREQFECSLVFGDSEVYYAAS